MGGLYDSRVGATSGLSSEEDHKDNGLALNLGAGWQFYKKDNLSLRLDYNGYASFYSDYNEYNVIDQSILLDPQYLMGDFVFSMPIGFNYVLEDTKSDFYRNFVMPTITYLLPGSQQAISINGLFSRIKDKDDSITSGVDLDEDGDSYGGGCAYFFYLVKNCRIRLSADYQHSKYDDTEQNYAIVIGDYTDLDPQKKREDDLLTANVDIQYQLNSFSSLYTTYTYINTDSNINLYEYDRSIVEAGVEFHY
jgi:hypothetical protein